MEIVPFKLQSLFLTGIALYPMVIPRRSQGDSKKKKRKFGINQNSVYIIDCDFWHTCVSSVPPYFLFAAVGDAGTWEELDMRRTLVYCM